MRFLIVQYIYSAVATIFIMFQLVDPNTLYLDPGSEICSNLDPDPSIPHGYIICLEKFVTNSFKTIKYSKKIFFFTQYKKCMALEESSTVN